MKTLLLVKSFTLCQENLQRLERNKTWQTLPDPTTRYYEFVR